MDFARERDFKLVAGELTFRLARELGFCYGVDRAVEYAYEARARFPGKKIFITGEIIHNPFVNGRLSEMGIEFLDGPYGTDEKFASITADDVVLLPAFGVSTGELEILRRKGMILVDTTCGSVMNVWKNVDSLRAGRLHIRGPRQVRARRDQSNRLTRNQRAWALSRRP